MGRDHIMWALGAKAKILVYLKCNGKPCKAVEQQLRFTILNWHWDGISWRHSEEGMLHQLEGCFNWPVIFHNNANVTDEDNKV